MIVVVNGVRRDVAEGSSLVRFIEEMGLDRRFLVVEYNGAALARDAFEGIDLRDGDQLELVRPVAGG